MFVVCCARVKGLSFSIAYCYSTWVGTIGTQVPIMNYFKIIEQVQLSGQRSFSTAFLPNTITIIVVAQLYCQDLGSLLSIIHGTPIVKRIAVKCQMIETLRVLKYL